jgi:hypothetical protein
VQATVPDRRNGDSQSPIRYPAKRVAVADFHRARSTRSSRTRPGSNGLPPSPTAGWDSPLPGRRVLGGLGSRIDQGLLTAPEHRERGGYWWLDVGQAGLTALRHTG